MTGFRDVMVRLLGRRPERCPLAARLEERIELDGVVRERVTYETEEGERIPAYLFVPVGTSATERKRGIFAHHQHAGEFHLGKSEVAGLAGNPEQAYALELARRGHVVLAPDAIAFEERGAYGGVLERPAPGSTPGPNAGAQRERFEFTKRILHGACLQTKMVWDMQRGLDYLVSRPEVDPERLGCIGHSLGGQQTLFLAALDPRVKAAVSSCGFASMATVLRDGISHNFGAYVPDWLSHGDAGELLGAAAPCAFLAFNGEDDRIFPIDGVHETFAVARRAYEAMGVGERLALRVMPGGHQFSHTMRAEAYAWLERWLA
jgi:dienelactone hydrolase